MHRTAGAILFASLLLTTSAYASGYGLRDVSASTLGAAYAGNAANGKTASTLDFNPALVNDVKTFDIAVSNTGLLPQTSGDFKATNAAGLPVSGTAHPVDIVNTALMPSIALRYRLTDKIAVGLQMSAPWGMLTNYHNTGVTRYFATSSDVKSANTQFIVGYQLTPELSIAAGAQLQYIKGRLAKAIDVGSISYSLYAAHTLPVLIPGTVPGGNDGFAEMRAQTWSTGWVLGAEWKPRPDLSVGLSYRSAVYNTLTGNEYYTLDTVGQTLRSYTGLFQDGTMRAKLHNPPIVTFGARWQIDDQWTVMVGGDWTGWSITKNLTIHSNNVHQPDDVTMFNYQDSWFGSVGAEYKIDDQWKVSAGTGYDQSPTTSNWRTPGIPDSGRFWLTAGVGYTFNQNIDIDLSVARLVAQRSNIALKQSDTGNSARGNLVGDVNMRVTLVGVELNYHL